MHCFYFISYDSVGQSITDSPLKDTTEPFGGNVGVGIDRGGFPNGKNFNIEKEMKSEIIFYILYLI